MLASVIGGSWLREISPGGRCDVVGFDGRDRLPLPTLVAGKGVQREVSDTLSPSPSPRNLIVWWGSCGSGWEGVLKHGN